MPWTQHSQSEGFFILLFFYYYINPVMDKFRITFFWLNILHPVPETSHYESKMVCEWQLTLNLTNQPL